jgi:hypothetical protein
LRVEALEQAVEELQPGDLPLFGGVVALALPGDLSSITSTRALADQINAAGVFDAIIHSAALRVRRVCNRRGVE